MNEAAMGRLVIKSSCSLRVFKAAPCVLPSPARRWISNDVTATDSPTDHAKVQQTNAQNNHQTSTSLHSPRKKTQIELDEELRLKMAGLAGDGGESGIEYEDGQPVSMKRSVRENMFRYI